jgi:hypothetical protein
LGAEWAALSLGHNDITRFPPWSPIVTGNHLDRAKRKNSKNCSDDWHRRFWELLHVQMFMNDGPNPLTWDAQLLRYWFSWSWGGGLPRLAHEFY